ncbi:MAG: PA14 domain-containing protein [Opitutaceae bacterium]
MTSAQSQESLTVVSGTLPNGVAPERMVETWMRERIKAAYGDWQADFLRLQKEGGWEAHHRVLREALLESIGGLPERTPLNARVTGTVERPGFRVEKILLESQPGFHVTANLYLPDSERFAPPYAGVLVPCGHAIEAKAHHEYQSMGALLALNGFVGLVFDPLDQSERMQFQREDGSRPYYGTHMHMQEGVAAILLGEGLIRTFIWDGMRALDYLESRPEVDPDRLAVTGNSGGGTQTSFLFALDERLKVAAPSCYVHLLNRQLYDSMGDAEQMIYAQLAIGLEHPSFYLMRAPAPVKILASTHDFFPIDAVWEGFRFIKRRYTDLGYSERADILENNEGHNYDRTQREAAIRWINLWLNADNSAIVEPELALFSEQELRVTPTGQVLDLDGARSVFDLFREKLEALRPERDRTWNESSPADQRKAVRAVVGIREMADLPLPEVHDLGSTDHGDYTRRRILLETEEGLFLPVVELVPRHPSAQPPLIVVGPDGAARSVETGSLLEHEARLGRRIVAVDIRGTGETRQTGQNLQGDFFGFDQEDVYGAYLLGESFLGLRVEDILRAVRYVAAGGEGAAAAVDLQAEGQIGVAALHAAFLEPDLIGRTTIRGSIESWEDILVRERSFHQLANTVQGVLRVYDLPFLKEGLGDRVSLVLPVDSLGFVDLPEGAPLPEGYTDPVEPGLVGTFYGNAQFLNPQGEYAIERLSLHYDNAVDRRGNDWAGIWEGFLVGPVDGRVAFEVESDQVTTLIIDGRTLIGPEDLPGAATAELGMEAGKPYPIEVRFQLPSGGLGFFDIRWSWEGRPPEVIGRSALRHSEAQAAGIRKAWR